MSKSVHRFVVGGGLAALASIAFAAYVSTYMATPSGERSEAPSVSATGHRFAYWRDNGWGQSGIVVREPSTNTTWTVNPPGIVKVGRPRLSRDGKFVGFYGTGTDNVVKPFGVRLGAAGTFAWRQLPLPAASTTVAVGEMLGLETIPVSNELGVDSNEARFVYRDLTGRPCESDPGTDRTRAKAKTTPSAAESGPPSAYLKGPCIWNNQLYESTMTSSWNLVTASVAGSPGTPLNYGGTQPSITADGSMILYVTSSPELSHWPNGQVRYSTWNSGWVINSEIVSRNSSGVTANAPSSWPSVSADGRYVAFLSYAGNLHASDSGNFNDVFVKDRTVGTVYRAYTGNTDPDLASNHDAFDPQIAPSGTFVSFVLGTADIEPINWCDGPVCAPIGAAGVYVSNFATAQATLESYKLYSANPRIFKYGLFPTITNNGNNLLFSSGDPGIAMGDNDGKANVIRKDTRL